MGCRLAIYECSCWVVKRDLRSGEKVVGMRTNLLLATERGGKVRSGSRVCNYLCCVRFEQVGGRWVSKNAAASV